MSATERRSTEGRRDYVRFAVAAFVVGAVVWFAVDNSQRVTIDWWVTEQRSRLIYVIVVSAILGAAADRLVRRRRARRRS